LFADSINRRKCSAVNYRVNASVKIINCTHQHVIKTINRSTAVTAQPNVSTSQRNNSSSTDNISRPLLYVLVINITHVVTDGDYCQRDERHPCCHCHEPSTYAPQTWQQYIVTSHSDIAL